MPTTVTIKGQVTLPKAVREAAGIRPGDRVNVRALPEGGVVIEKDEAPMVEPDEKAVEAARRRVDQALAALDRSGITFSMTPDEWLRLLRDDD
jgi:AbrB family looped-hinge helix DNA binding protein